MSTLLLAGHKRRDVQNKFKKIPSVYSAVVSEPASDDTVSLSHEMHIVG
jgi:hypothetical protein